MIEALGSVPAGSTKPFVITSGTGIGNAEPGRLATEEVFNTAHPNPRIASEMAGPALLAAGVDVRVVRLSQVHDTVKQGLITPYIALPRERGARPMSAKGAIAGRRRMCSTSRVSTGSSWKKGNRVPGTMHRRRKVFASAPSPRSWEAA